MTPPLLQVQNLTTLLPNTGGSIPVVKDISFEIQAGETFALLGESGSGKSITALSLLRLLPLGGRIGSGSVCFEGQNLLTLTESNMRKIRGKDIAMIFQEPATSLSPVLTIGQQINEVLTQHRILRGAAAREQVIQLLHDVGIPKPQQCVENYPFQLSGGMKQRAMIAMALAGNPRLLIADEPTTALDVTIQAQILDLLAHLQAERGMAILLITHDLGVVSRLAHHVAVMKLGTIVETAPSAAFFSAPKHPYSQQLFAALPSAHSSPSRNGAQRKIVGDTAEDTEDTLLKVRDLKVYFPMRSGLFQREKNTVKAVDGVSFQIKAGHTLALVGESGCGKTTTGKAILGLIQATEGTIQFRQTDVTQLNKKEMQPFRRVMQIVFQDPFASLNPRMRIRSILKEGMDALKISGNTDEAIAYIMEQVGLSPDMLGRYPHEFSGGQRQRIAIARALAVKPQLLICDEPTSALDVSIQAQILDLLENLQHSLGLSYLFITHNIAVVEQIAHDVAVMYQGRIVEQGSMQAVLHSPQHPYTKRLLSAVLPIRHH